MKLLVKKKKGSLISDLAEYGFRIVIKFVYNAVGQSFKWLLDLQNIEFNSETIPKGLNFK